MALPASTPASTSVRPTLVITPAGQRPGYWSDLWRFRELFLFLAWRDALVRYRQTVIGLGWVLLKPLLQTIVLTVIFGRLAKLPPPTDGTPYALLVLTGMVSWQCFANVVGEASISVINNASLVTKIYFPRLMLPLSTVLVNLADVAVTSLCLLGVIAWYGCWPGWSLALLPLALLPTVLAAVGVGVWVSALMVRYRDFKNVVPFVLQAGLLMSPVGFSSSLVPERWRAWYALNPMTGAIDAVRACALPGGTMPWTSIGLSLGFSTLLLITGCWYFRRTEKTFADVI